MTDTPQNVPKDGPQDGLLDALTKIVGPAGWTRDPERLEPHLTEWRGIYRGKTRIMLAPASTAEVAAVVRVCADAGVGIVPQGGNTGLCGGAVPDQSGEQVLLSLTRMNRVRSIDPLDYSMVAEAGCVLASVQERARAVDRLFPLSLSAEGSCQIGGNLSTDAGGINVLRYGTARQLVLGLEVVLADGTIWEGLRSLRKDTAGYDLKQLFLGSEGTLGIITAACLRLFPLPGEVGTAMVAVATPDEAVALLSLLKSTLGDRIQAFELIAARAMRFVERHIPGSRYPFDQAQDWHVLIDAAIDSDAAGFEEALAGAFADGLASDAVIAKNEAEAESWWRIRHSISEAQKYEGASIKHDIAVPIGRIGEFLRRGEHLIADVLPAARPCVFGHVGDGNLHYNVSVPHGMPEAVFRERGVALTEAIYALVGDMDGSISAEHGIGVAKKASLARHKSATDLRLMRQIKQALDPAGILNPGKVI